MPFVHAVQQEATLSEHAGAKECLDNWISETIPLVYKAEPFNAQQISMNNIILGVQISDFLLYYKKQGSSE